MKCNQDLKLQEFKFDSYRYIDSYDELIQAVKILTKYDCLGIDIENHSNFSYEGFICLI